jgi:hypothetical protein
MAVCKCNKSLDYRKGTDYAVNLHLVFWKNLVEKIFGGKLIFADVLNSARATDMDRNSFGNKGSDVSGVSNSVTVKYCSHDGEPCCYSSCDFLDSRGHVRICRRHKNRGGFHLRRGKASSVAPIFNKHLRIIGFLFTVFSSSVSFGIVRFDGWSAILSETERCLA